MRFERSQPGATPDRDAAGQRYRSQNALGRITTTVFDLAGRTQATINPLNFRATQVYDAAGKPLKDQKGTAEGLPVWGLPAAFADREGGFTIMY